MGTKWEQVRNENLKVGQEWEQRPQNGARTRMVTKREQSGDHKGKDGNKVGTK